MKFKTALVATGTALSIAISGCASARDAAPEVAATVAATTGPALWKVADEDTTIYLFGTVHVLPAGVDWYDSRIESAFTSSDILVTEVDMTDQAAMAAAIAQNAMLGGGRTLRSLMSDENRSEYETVLTDLGLPPAVLDQFEPWFAALNLGVLPLLQAGYDPNAGVEMALESRAGDKQRGALETIDEQIELFDGMTMDYQLEYLDATVEGAEGTVSMIDEMVTEWLEGDADRLAELMNGEIDDSYLRNRLLIDRNANWVGWIEQRLDQPGTAFIAVGAGHLAGSGSVQDQLEDRGHVVTRILE